MSNQVNIPVVERAPSASLDNQPQPTKPTQVRKKEQQSINETANNTQQSKGGTDTQHSKGGTAKQHQQRMAGNKKQYKKKKSSNAKRHPENKIETHNRFDILTNETNLNATEGNPSPTRNHKPPPTVIHGVINYGAMIKQIRNIAEDEQYSTNACQTM